jgi:cell division protein FtsI (penicillin-binding protein 3)
MRPSARRYKQTHSQAQTGINVLKARLNMVVIVIFILQCFIVCAIINKAYQSTQEPKAQIQDYFTKEVRRGNIYDASGTLLATSLKVNSLYADPKMMLDVNNAVYKLAKVLPDLNIDYLQKRLSNKNRRFVWIKRNLSPKQAYAVNALGIPGFAFKKEYFRTYPNGNLAAHVLGNINRNGKGVSGVEKSLNEKLENGEDVKLTINASLQNTLRDALAKELLKTNASSAWAIAIKPTDGSILASVSLPDYDANFYNKAQDIQLKDRTVSDVFEMGSINKTYTYALGFDEGIINLNSILDATRPIRIGRYTIRDAYPKNKWLSTVDAFKYSSNVSASRVADEFSVEQQKNFYRKLHLLESLKYDLGETTSPIVPDDAGWKRLKKMTLSYGYGLALTPLQSIAALSSIGNSGYYVKPKFLDNTQTIKEKVISDDTVHKMKRLFNATVEEGTGHRAKIKGYLIGGKTGTAEILEKSGEYNKKQNLATFIGFAPLDKPEFIVLVGVNSPQGKHSGGGSVAAPVFKEFAEKAFAILNIRPTLYKMQDKGQQILKTNKGEL